MKILIIGKLPDDVQTRILYEGIIRIVKDYAFDIRSPIDTAEFEGSDEERYERAFDTLKGADLVIAEVSEPSTGQGMEIGEAINLGKKIIVIARKGSKVSGLIKGCPDLGEIIYYRLVEDLKEDLRARIDIHS